MRVVARKHVQGLGDASECVVGLVDLENGWKWSETRPALKNGQLWLCMSI